MNIAALPAALVRTPQFTALLAGGLTVLSFAPFGFWPLQIATLALLFWLLMKQDSMRRSFLTGWAFGAGWCIFGVYWLYISMHHYGGLPSWMAVLAVILLGMALGLYAALAATIAAWFRKRGTKPWIVLLGILPAAWMLTEWLRGWMFTGFPWIVSGYAHTNSPLAGFAPVVGVYGTGWLAALAAASLVLMHTRRAAVVIFISVFAIGAGLRSMNWTQPHGLPISVRLLQGNVPQQMKFDVNHISTTLAQYYQMITEEPADLIATPETALPVLSKHLPPNYLPQFSSFARESGSHVVIGVPMSDGPDQYANSALGFSPAITAGIYRYDKHHLVPFGEFIPIGARWFVEMMNIPLGDFTRGTLLQPPFAVKDQWVMPNICYEDLFGEEIADQIAAGIYDGKPQPTILLNMSNIAWFGDTIALPQHLQISQMRSLETGRPMLRATNSGATAVIGPDGRVTALLQPFTRGALAATVQGRSGWTPYILYGNTPVVVLALAVIAATLLWLRKKSL